MNHRFPGLVITLGVAAFFAGCSTGGLESNPFTGGQGGQEVKVYITNLAFMDATVYGVTDGGRRRLGRVTGKREMVFTMPLRTPSRMYLEIDIMAGPRCETERLIVDPGDQLELIIQHENANWRCYGR